MRTQTQHLVEMYTNAHTLNPRNVWDTWRTIFELAVCGVNNHFD